MALAIVRRDDWSEVLQREFSHRLRETFDPSRGRERFASRCRADSADFPGCRKVWSIGDEVTEFPVIEYELKVPW